VERLWSVDVAPFSSTEGDNSKVESTLSRPAPMTVEMSDSLFSYDRDLGCRYVCGADEVGRAAWAGPLVAAAVRFDYERLDTETVARLAGLNDSKRVSPGRRAALLPVIMEVADMVAVVVVSAAQIDRDGLDVVNVRALAAALEVVAVPGAVRLVDWFDLQGVEDPPRRVEKRRWNVGRDCGGINRCQGDARQAPARAGRAVSRLRVRCA
jgi:ribonuclease HII